MSEIWVHINLWLNSIGGLISIVSLAVSIFIYVKTGQIKNNIKNLLNHDKYINQQDTSKERFSSIVDSITKDDIFDINIIRDITCEIALLEHYSVFFDNKTKRNIKRLKKILKNDISDIKRDKLVVEISKVIGDLKFKETYLG
ncbi:hypothetical protein RWZ02_10910 [Clostridium butyricum]|uniref:hypothetical protein n=1 Tax=Clostridium butyricum TaxID=1492 RepID=UPI0028FD098D|nr:hypothetical protein [Clostridium butyricum]MDU0323189.1 hypothetical protein [Clostridium butyricum]